MGAAAQAAGGGRAALLELVREGNRAKGGLLAKVVTGGERPGLWLLDNTGPGAGENLNTRLVRDGAASWSMVDLARLGPAAKPKGEEAGWRAERLNLLEVQRALVAPVWCCSCRRSRRGPEGRQSSWRRPRRGTGRMKGSCGSGRS